jgi:phosphatidylserine/phosphatidylglycerophosphate/cardiolipin synthase-like enzyme
MNSPDHPTVMLRLDGDPCLKPGLRPDPDRRLPDDLRPEDVGCLTEALAEGVRGAEFERLVQRIDTGPIHAANKVNLFFNGEETFVSVVEAIERATQEILLETYILKDDATGHELAERLGRAAARGVKVRVLADALGSWGDEPRLLAADTKNGNRGAAVPPVLGSFVGPFHSRPSQDHRN